MRLLIVVLIYSFSSMALAKNYSFSSKLKSKIKRPLGLKSRTISSLFLTKKQCSKMALNKIKNSKRSIKSFTLGTKFKNADLNGDFAPAQVGEDYGNWAKLGLPEDHFYKVKKMSTEFAPHADTRCGKFAKVTHVDKIIYQGKSCRRISIKLDKLEYKTFFCAGDTKGYVDHFGLTKAI